MILEYLQPDPDIWDGVAVVVRAGYYVASLGAAGLALFAIGYGHRLTPAEGDRLRARLAGAVGLAILLSLVAALVRVQILSAGDLANLAVWDAMLRSRVGDAAAIRIAGLLLLVPLAAGWRIGPALAGAGALMVVASYAAMGHSMLYRPRQEIAFVVVTHLAALSFWAGSLLPLAWVARRGDQAAALLVRDWSRAAMVAVGLLVASGAWGAVMLIQRADLVAGSWYGNGFVVKMLLVAIVFAFAAAHKFWLGLALERGEPGAGARLSTSIRFEILAMLLVFYAAAEMVSVHPVDVGHRVN